MASNAELSVQPLPLISRKLAVPEAPAHVVERPRLDVLLGTLIENYRTVVVAATAGAGKTTAVACAAANSGRAVAWLTVDRTDTAPGRLLTYLEAALARAVPDVAGLATHALAARLPHPEVAGLLADALGATRIVVVLDELERLGEQAEAWAVIEAFLRYAPPTTSVVLLSRREVPAELCALPPMHQVAVLGEEHLAFTVDEASAALSGLGRMEVDATDVVGSTGGWVTGVLFDAWRASDHVAGVGGEADPLNGYLSAHIMAGLSAEDQEFLIVSSLLDEVDVERATALGLACSGERLESLRHAHLPVTWSESGFAMRCHSRFREYLQARLHRRDRDELRRLRLAHGRLLASEGADEEAVEELLQAGAAEEALPIAELAIVQVIERLDVTIAERWLRAFEDLASTGPSPITTAELMLAIGRDDLRSAVRIADQLEALGERDQLAAASQHAALFMSWAYLHVTRLDDILAVLDAADAGPMTAAIRYAAEIMIDVPRAEATVPPALSGGPLDALVSLSHYAHGRLSELTDVTMSPWVQAVVTPYRVAALRALGQTKRALELFEAAPTAAPWRHWVGPDLLLDVGRTEEARELAAAGRTWAQTSGSTGFEGFIGLSEAKLALRADADPAAATAILDRIERLPRIRALLIVSEMLDCWYGLALLMQGDDVRALERLQRAVTSMTAGDRILELPTAATYLAEACWRAGDEQGADEAADLALAAAQRQGSNHLLLQALADVPAVLSRRLDAEPAADSPWHAISRAFVAQGADLPEHRALVHLSEFGRRAISVGGEHVKPRLNKAYELLAYLVARRPEPASRDDLLDALFEGRRDDSTRAHLRQAMQGLRQLLPGDDPVPLGDDGWRLGDDVRIVSESTALEADLTQAARLQGDERLAATLAALAPADRGEYLPGSRSSWADTRAEALAELVTGARLDAADLAYERGRLDDAGRLAQQVLEGDPFREVAWRLQMRIASALGDDDAVIRAFQACERALAEAGATPSKTTQRLLDELRR